MKDMTVNLTINATVDYGFKYKGDLTENEVSEVIRTKYHGNIWLALRDDFIADIDWEEVDEVLNGLEKQKEEETELCEGCGNQVPLSNMSEVQEMYICNTCEGN